MSDRALPVGAAVPFHQGRDMRRFTRTGPLLIAAALAAVGASACDDAIEAQRDEFLLAFPGDPLHPWLVCDVFEAPEVVSGTVTGGESSTLTLPRGHRLDIPATALPTGQSVSIQFGQIASAAVAIELLPRNQEFADSLTLTLVYEGRSCGVGDPATLAIYRARVAPPHEPLPPAGEAGAGRVSGRMDHFSEFAIAR